MLLNLIICMACTCKSFVRKIGTQFFFETVARKALYVKQTMLSVILSFGVFLLIENWYFRFSGNLQ